MHQWNQDQTHPWKLMIPIQKIIKVSKAISYFLTWKWVYFSQSIGTSRGWRRLKKLENSDDSSESISCNSDIHEEEMKAIMRLNMMKILTKLKN